MKKILVPFDFSPHAIEALKFAIDLAKKEEAEISMIHSVEFPAMIDSSVALEFEKAYLSANRVKAIKRMNRIAHRLLKGGRINTIVDFGGPVHAIERAIETSRADLVVMGTQGASGLKEITVGSNTEKIVRRSPVPVVAIRKAVKSIANIVFPFSPATDHQKEVQQKEIVDLVKEFGRLFNAKIHVVFINTPSSFRKDAQAKAALESFAKKYNLTDCTLDVYNDINEVDGIMNYTHNLKDSMVAMSTHGRRGIRHLVTGSIAETVVNHIKSPITTLRIAS